MEKSRKESNCKSKRLERLILELYNNTTLTSSEIAKTIKLTTPTVKKVAKQNGIDQQRIDQRPPSIWLDEVRNNKIIEAIKRGDTYDEIAKEFNITRQRVYQFAVANGLTRWKAKREKFGVIINEINKDFDGGMSYSDLVVKYNMNDASFKHSLKYYGLESLVSRFRNTRNNKIVHQYQTMPAIAIVRNPNPILNDPTRITTVGRVYHITSKSGLRKHPNVERGVKGIFVDPAVLKIIKARKNSPYKYTNQQIADELNERGFKTTYGNKFLWHTVQNIWGKYQKQGARKTKVKYKK